MTLINKHIGIYKNKLRILISVSFLVLSIIILLSIFIIINKVGKPLLIEENNHLLEQYGNKTVALLGQEILMAESLTATLANLGETLDYDVNTYKKIIPHLINLEDQRDLIAGGGIWPEPYVFDPNLERRSFFWGKDSSNQFIYYDDYNNPEGNGYHNEEWYVPSKYITSDLKFWSGSYMDPYSFQPMVTCTSPIKNDSVYKGAATIDLRLEGLNAFLQSAMEKSGGYAYAFDRNNKLLSFPNEKFAKNISVDSTGNIIQEFLNADELAKKDSSFIQIATYLKEINKTIINLSKNDTRFNPELPQIIANESYQINTPEAELISAIMLDPLKEQTRLTNRLSTFHIKNDIILHEPVIVSVFHMPRTYWKIVIVTPYYKSKIIINHITQKLILLFSIVLLISLFATFLLLRTKILTPLRKLSIQLKKIAHTPIKEAFLLDYKAKNEIGELVYWLNHRTKELQHSTKALRESEKKYRTIFENTGTASLIVDEDSTISLVNEEFIYVSGFSKDEIENKKKWTEFVVAEELERMMIQHKLRREDPDKALKSYETRLKDRHGNIHTVILHMEMIPGTKKSIATLLDITKRKQAEEELIKAKEHAEESDRLKTAFLQNISHEIRTPLNAIYGFTGFLNDKDLTEEDREFYVKIIQSSSDQLVSIVTDILTISSLEANQIKVDVSKVCINNILDELYVIFKEQSQNKEVDLLTHKGLDDGQSEIFTDKTKLTQILVNLLSNAFKFTNKGSIEFGYRLKEGIVEFYVKDTGLGIPEKFQKTIFKRFGQVKHKGPKLYSGTGLGLSISKGFVKLLGGKIRVESVHKNGSTFYFTIPYKTTDKK